LVIDTNVYVDWINAGRHGDVERDHNIASSHSIVNDVLIALSARASGAVVVTQNERDFRAIQTIRPFRLEVVPA